jgi:two-component system chemotaxis response regulator CheY
MPKILVIDDDKMFRLYLTTLLERAGYEVHALGNSSAAEMTIEAERFDAVVTDLYMPHFDGIEIVRTIKRATPGVPVIGVSGSPLGSRDPCTKAMSVLGADAMLTKPLDSAAFLTILRSAIDGAPQSPCIHSNP